MRPSGNSSTLPPLWPRTAELPASMIAARLAGWVIGRMREDAVAFGIVAPVHDGVVMFLRGAVWCAVTERGSTRQLSGERALTWVDQIVPGTFDRLAVAAWPSSRCSRIRSRPPGRRGAGTGLRPDPARGRARQRGTASRRLPRGRHGRGERPAPHRPHRLNQSRRPPRRCTGRGRAVGRTSRHEQARARSTAAAGAAPPDAGRAPAAAAGAGAGAGGAPAATDGSGSTQVRRRRRPGDRRGARRGFAGGGRARPGREPRRAGDPGPWRRR